MKNIIEFIPSERQNIIDYQEIGKAVDAYYEEKIAQLRQIKLNTDVLEADEKTIEKLEKRMNIIPTSSASLEERRYKCWIKQTAHSPFTEQWMRHWLREFIGDDNYSLVFDYEAGTSILKMTLKNESNYDAIAAMLDEVVPAHIQYIITYLFNTWQNVKDRGTWQDIKDFGTWEDVRKSEDL